jgi:Histidine kinase
MDMPEYTVFEDREAIGKSFGFWYLISSCFWSVLGAIACVQIVVNQYMMEMTAALPHLLLVQGARFMVFALLSPPLIIFVQLLHRQAMSWKKQFWVYSASVPVFICIAALVRWLVLPPWAIKEQMFMPRSWEGLYSLLFSQFSDYLTVYVIVIGFANAAALYVGKLESEKQRAELERFVGAHRLKVLKDQLRPHFLFNTLSGISALTTSDAASAKAMLSRLSELLRASLEFGDQEFVTLQQEFALATSYLEIEKMRLGPRLQVNWQVQEECRHSLVPHMVLLPLVENAVVHGAAELRQGGWISVEIWQDAHQLHVKVSNNFGTGRKRQGTGVGLKNVGSRLQQLFQGAAKISFDKGENGVAVALVEMPRLAESETRSEGYAAVLDRG